MKNKSTKSWPGLIKRYMKQYRLSVVHQSCLIMAGIFSAVIPCSVSATDLDYSVTVTKEWESGYCAALTITNTTDRAVTWSIDLQVDGTVNNLWNGVWHQNGSTLSVSGTGWNNILVAGQSYHSIGYCVTRNARNDESKPSSGTHAGHRDPSAPVHNLAENGGVEYSLDHWSVTAGKLTRSTTESHHGVASALISGRSAGWNGITFDAGTLTEGHDYDVAVWVKLAPGAAGSADIYLTAKQTNDRDSSTTKAYERIATTVATSGEWTLLHGTYTQSANPLAHFIIESDDAEVDFYADDFSISRATAVDEVSSGGSDDGNDEVATTQKTCDLPSSFSWTSTDPVITPHDDNLVSIKDPSIVEFGGKYHVFASVVNKQGKYSSVYLNFKNWSDADKADQFSMEQAKTGSTVAPEVFYFKPHNQWYLIYQWGARYSTNTDISDPSGWSAPKTLLANEPDGALDYWVICDDDNCYLFFSRDDGKLYRSKVSIDRFPEFQDYEVVMSDETAGDLYEASNVYKVSGKSQYLLLVEAYAPRYFRSWTANSLDGPWTPLADTQSNPFAGEANVTFTGEKWTRDISHGEMIRAGYDQTLTIDPCHLQYLYQGRDPASDSGTYDARPYQLGLLTAQ